MTTIEQEHKEVYQTISESIVADPETHTVTEIDPRVLRGVLYLDEHYPGWAKKINLRNFHLADSSRCVLGQLYGGYTRPEVERLFHLSPDTSIKKNDKIAQEHGLLADYITYPWEIVNKEYQSLEKDWRIMIKERQGG